MARESTVCSLLLALAVAGSTPAAAQPLGTFRWQLQPFCNVITVTVTQLGGQFTLDGHDDQCGAAQHAPLVGVATQNPDGTIGLGLVIVTVPGGGPVAVEARISLTTVSGPWQDSAGHSGTLAFGASSGGAARPAPPLIPPAIALRSDGGFLAGGAFGAGSIPASGAGARLMWYPGKSAFRAGLVDGAQWDDANVGVRSTAMGFRTRASGDNSTAIGFSTTASGTTSTAMGAFTTASGTDSTAMGFATAATGLRSTAMGSLTTASGDESTAIGLATLASGDNSTAMGVETAARAFSSTAMGRGAETTASAVGSFVYGDASDGIVASSLPNQFLVRAAGGVVFWSSANTTTGSNVALFSGTSAWSSLSDVNSKENFRDIAAEEVLAKIAAMPVREWNFKTQDRAIRHLGPTAQDFHAAFGLGEDPLRISTLDADGVALAAVRALEARTTRLAGNDSDLAQENADLRAQIRDLERAVGDLRAVVATLGQHR